MTQKEIKLLRDLGKAVESLSDVAREYILGFAEGLILKRKEGRK